MTPMSHLIVPVSVVYFILSDIYTTPQQLLPTDPVVNRLFSSHDAANIFSGHSSGKFCLSLPAARTERQDGPTLATRQMLLHLQHLAFSKRITQTKGRGPREALTGCETAHCFCFCFLWFLKKPELQPPPPPSPPRFAPLQKIKESNLDEWKNIRGPRPWEDSREYQEQQRSRQQGRKD